MKFAKRFSIGLLFAIAVLPLRAVAQVAPGTPAPEISAKDIEGKEVTLAALKGKNVVLEWVNFECPFVVMHYQSENIPKLQKRFADAGVVWLSIHSSGAGKQGYFTPDQLKEQGKKFKSLATHVIADPKGEIGKAYDAKTTPHMMLVDAAGVVRYNGAIDSIPSTEAETLTKAVPQFADAVDAVLAGKEPSPAATKPYGCSIKFAE